MRSAGAFGRRGPGRGAAGFAKKAGIRYTMLLDKDSSVAQDYRVDDARKIAEALLKED